MQSETEAKDIRVYGLVQGVGFRPFLHRIAEKHEIHGWVLNRNDCVQVRIESSQKNIELFISNLKHDAPPLSRIEKIEVNEAAVEHLQEFVIMRSASDSAAVTRVSPDIAVCDDCIDDMRSQSNRINYPFVNCTNCGPRFSIVKDLPYDRFQTTMNEFVMCENCRNEYDDIRNRRFHAQPNACRDCGPSYELKYNNEIIKEIEPVLDTLTELLEEGKIAALKGVGGFHLACDANNNEAVMRLRQGKNREGKPFAVMCGSLEAARRQAEINEEEAQLMQSVRRPIVLLRKSGGDVAPLVTIGMHTIGVMLTYMPLHHLLFERLKIETLVLTSGNISDEPIAIHDGDALSRLSGVADAYLLYNRIIHNRSDDSVLMIARNKQRILRRSRGWAPEPVNIKSDADGIAAVGGEMKNCFCIGKERAAIISQHIGDLKNPETYEFFLEAFDRFSRLFRFSPQLIACDMHPDYLSTRYAKDRGIPVLEVQHHHAHIASCLAENQCEDRVIGVALDGTGYGDDGAIWGGEFLICDLEKYTRYTHFDYIPLPGGDAVAVEPWRTAISLLYRTFGKQFVNLDLPIIRNLRQEDLALIISAIDAGVNCPLTSSTGRLFDAVSALVGLLKVSSFEAEAPMKLEAIIEHSEDVYDFSFGDTIKAGPVVEQIVKDIENNVSPGIIAAKFHNAVVNAVTSTTVKIRAETGIRKVALSGGVFQNRYILERCEATLEMEKFEVLSHVLVPANDGGICLGQLAVAANKRSAGIAY